MYSVFLSSYTNTCESLGELEKTVETLTGGSCSHSISRSPKFPLVFVFNNYSTIFTEPEGNNCFSIISELNNRDNGLKHKNKHAIVRLHSRM